MRRGRGQLPVLDLGGEHGVASPFPVAAEEGVGEDAVQPGLQVRARLELPEGGVCPGERFLDQIFGVRPVAGHAQRRRIQLRQVGQRVALKPRGPLPGRFRDRICFLAAPDRHDSATVRGHASSDSDERPGRWMPSAQVSASSDRGRLCVWRARRPLLRRARWVQDGASGLISGIAGSAGQREADPGERPVGALPGRFRPPTAGPKLGVSLCPPAQFTLALAGELFPHVRVHGPHVVRGRRARASALARTTSGSRGSGGSASLQERSRRALGFWIRIRFTVISSAMSGPGRGEGPGPVGGPFSRTV